jgi:hypothetical protein
LCNNFIDFIGNEHSSCVPAAVLQGILDTLGRIEQQAVLAKEIAKEDLARLNRKLDEASTEILNLKNALDVRKVNNF